VAHREIFPHQLEQPAARVEREGLEVASLWEESREKMAVLSLMFP
jgi:hypothetical protein